MKKKYSIVVMIILAATALYPQIVGVSQTVTTQNKVEQPKKVTPLPPVSALINPKEKLADEIQAENRAERTKALALQDKAIKDAKKVISQKERIIYRTIYKKTTDTIFIPVPVGSTYNPADSNDYFTGSICKPDTVYIQRKGWLQKLFNW